MGKIQDFPRKNTHGQQSHYFPVTLFIQVSTIPIDCHWIAIFWRNIDINLRIFWNSFCKMGHLPSFVIFFRILTMEILYLLKRKIQRKNARNSFIPTISRLFFCSVHFSGRFLGDFPHHLSCHKFCFLFFLWIVYSLHLIVFFVKIVHFQCKIVRKCVVSVPNNIPKIKIGKNLLKIRGKTDQKEIHFASKMEVGSFVEILTKNPQFSGLNNGTGSQ